MSADLLREAAGALRERAEMATPGPWTQGHDDFHGPQAELISAHQGQPGYISGATTDEYRGAENTAYIATMHPGVGLALADLLETLAFDREVNYEIDGRTWDHNIVPLARLILGREAPS